MPLLCVYYGSPWLCVDPAPVKCTRNIEVWSQQGGADGKGESTPRTCVNLIKMDHPGTEGSGDTCSPSY